MAQTPEGKVKDKIKRVLKKHNCYTFMPVQYGYGAVGLDFMVCHRGSFIAIEAKSATGKLTGRQEKAKAEIERAGGDVFVVRDDATLAELDSWLDANE